MKKLNRRLLQRKYQQEQQSSKESTDLSELSIHILNAQIGCIEAPKGQNLFEVLLPNGDRVLVELPPRYRNFLWIRRGSFVKLAPFNNSNIKIYGEIEQVISNETIQYLQEANNWPFSKNESCDSGTKSVESLDYCTFDISSNSSSDDTFSNNSFDVNE